MSNPNAGLDEAALVALQKKAQAANAKKDGGNKATPKKGRGRPAIDSGYSDAKMAETIAKNVMRGKIAFNGAYGWMMYRGAVWTPVGDYEVVERMRQFVCLQYEDAKKREDKAAKSGWGSMLSASRLNAVSKLCRGIAGVAVNADDFDGHPYLLNTANCVVDLRTGESLDHNPSYYFTKICKANYTDPAEEGERDWEKVLEAVPEESREYLQLRIGQAATGFMTPDDTLMICQGGGENGKTTFFEGITKALGDYFVLVSDKVILSDPGNADTETTELKGARLALIEETPEARKLSVSRLKKVVGTPRMTARRLYKDSMTWDSSHSLFLTSNYKPIVEETDHGTWRRLQLMVFPYKFSATPVEGGREKLGDPNLRHRVQHSQDVWDAALAWMVEGAVRFYEKGGQFPDAPGRVAEDTLKWRGDTDVIMQFSMDVLEADPDGIVVAAEVLEMFNDWQGEAARDWATRTFNSRFTGHDFFNSNNMSEGRRIKTAPLGDRISRPRVRLGELPAQANVFYGVRFKGSKD